MARICIITPGHLATNPRVVKEADCLSRRGHDVLVISGNFIEWAKSEDTRIANASRWCHWTSVDFGPLAHPATRLRQALRQRLARARWRVGFRSLWLAETLQSPVTHDLRKAALHLKADLYCAHYVAALPAAADAALRHAGRFTFDAEDFHQGDAHPGPNYAREVEVVRTIESHYLPMAAGMTAAAPLIAEAYSESYGLPLPTSVLNVFPVQEAPIGPTRRGTAEGGPTVYWFSQTVGPNRGLETAVRACALAKTKPRLVLRGHVDESYRSVLTTLANEQGLRAVEFQGLAPPGEMVQLASGFDIGLCAETDVSRSRQIALTNKLFTYILAGVPAVLSDIPAHRIVARDLGGAARLFRQGDAESLAAALDDLLGSDDVLAEARGCAFHLGVSRFNWDVEEKTLAAALEGVLSAPASGNAATIRPTASAA